ncbi:hypothetical protein AB0873_14365 [Micromonospora sp. NPDC047707]|uniref:hypothetical protein n=1 Tax=Micromonospora sp. NPDC047707 TaxID=3154498 RepID=UPI0034514317
MRTAAETTEVRRPSAVRALTTLLAVTAAATVVVELLNFWYAPEQGFGLAVRTGWALLRSLGFLLLTTLCAAVVWLLYRSPALAGHLVRHRPRLVVDRRGVRLREIPPRRPEVSGWLLTGRVAAFTYSPLMLVPALVACGAVLDGRLAAVPAVLLWFAAGILTSYAVLFCTAFLLRGKHWARTLLVVVTFAVLAVDLPLCWWLLGADGLVRDGGPLVAAAALTLYALHRATRAEHSGMRAS